MRGWKRAVVGVVAATLLAAAIGAALTSLTHVSYRARAAVLVSAAGGPQTVNPLLPNLRELAQSSVLAGNVDTTLRLPGSAEHVRRRIHVSTPAHTQTVAFAVSDRHRERARQITQEAANVFVQLVAARFANAKPKLTAAVLDPAHVVSHNRPHYLRDPLLAAAVGFLVALALLTLEHVRERPPATADTHWIAKRESDFAERERTLQERVASVTARELAVARHTARLAERERDLDARQRQPSEPPPSAPASERPPPTEAPPMAPPISPPAPAGANGWTLNELERLVQANADRFPGSVDEWNAYLFFLRDHAEIDGRLPRNFDSLVQEVFHELFAARS